MRDYESRGGGSSPPESAQARLARMEERLVHTQEAGGPSPSAVVTEPNGEEPGCDPGRRGVGTLQSPHP